MPPKRIVHVEKAVAARPRQPKGFFQSTYESLTSASNATVVRSIGVFGVSVAFLSSPWAEFLLPAL